MPKRKSKKKHEPVSRLASYERSSVVGEGPVIIAIDPGMSGGIVVLDAHKNIVATYRMSEIETELAILFNRLQRWHHVSAVVIEDIPKWCGHNQFAARTIRASSLVVLYGNYKLCQGICMGLGFDVIKTRPQDWQKTVGMARLPDEPQTKWKARLRLRAEELADQKLHADVADAYLIGFSSFRADR